MTDGAASASTDGVVPCWACLGDGSRVSGGMVVLCSVCMGARCLPAAIDATITTRIEEELVSHE